MHGNGGGERCQRQQGIEDDGDDVCHGMGECCREDVGEGDEDQRGTCVGLHAYGEGCGEDHQSGEHCHAAVDGDNLQGGPQEVGLGLEIGGVGAEAGGAEADGEEGLSDGFEHHGAGNLGEVGMEEEPDALASVGQGARGCHEDEEEDEEYGHEYLGGFLYAALHSTDDYEVCQQDKEYGHGGGYQHVVLQLCEAMGDIVLVAQHVAGDGGIEVVYAPSCHDAVEAEYHACARRAHHTDSAP